MKKLIAMALSLAIVLMSFAACGAPQQDANASTGAKEFKVGICNYVDDASLNQIVENIQSRLSEIGAEKGVSFKIS